MFNPQPDVNDWFEAVKLNYGVDIQNGNKTYFDPVPDTWVKMKDILSYWANKKVDGFRCDMAEMVPVEFWNWVIPQIKEINPEIVFIAEIYQPDQYRNYLQQGKFDYLYDKVLLYDTLREMIAGKRSTLDIHQIQKRLSGVNHNMLHFLENHDEQRIASRFFAGDPWKAVSAMVISATIDQGPVMIFFGQEVGEPGGANEGFSGDDGRTTHFDYWGVPEHQKWMNNGAFDGGLLNPLQKQLRQFYVELLSLAAKNSALTQGNYMDITENNINAGNFDQKVHAFVRYKGEERLLIVSSFSDKDQTVKVQIPKDVANEIGLDANGTYIARDLLFRDTEVGFDKNLMFEVQLRPYWSYIFKIK